MNIEGVLLNDWHVVAEMETLTKLGVVRTSLFEVRLLVVLDSNGVVEVSRCDDRGTVSTEVKYGHVWVCLGTPDREIVDFPLARETDRVCTTGGSIRVATSGLRIVENFLDIGHLPFVHEGYLGEQPHTEVKPYKVSVTDEDHVLAQNCAMYQPLASPGAEGGLEVLYDYEIMRPYLIVLYKSNYVEPDRKDFIALMVQPVAPKVAIAHSFHAFLAHNLSEGDVRWFMQLIFSQDKPILENQRPPLLPLGAKSEIPGRADTSSVMYRRWLKSHGVRFGAVQ